MSRYVATVVAGDHAWNAGPFGRRKHAEDALLPLRVAARACMGIDESFENQIVEKWVTKLTPEQHADANAMNGNRLLDGALTALILTVNDAHTPACCAAHGCTFLDDECSVMAGARQDGPCWQCREELVLWEVSDVMALPPNTVIVRSDGRAAQRDPKGDWYLTGHSLPSTETDLLSGSGGCFIRVVHRP